MNRLVLLPPPWACETNNQRCAYPLIFRCISRVRWLQEPALQTLMGTCTWNYFFTMEQLSRYLDLPEADLAEVIAPQGTTRPCAPGHEELLRMFGIIKREFGHELRFCLLGCGHVAADESVEALPRVYVVAPNRPDSYTECYGLTYQ